MPDGHPAHRDLPALYSAELLVFRDRWRMCVIGPDRSIAPGTELDLGPADAHTTAGPTDPGRYLIDVTGSRVPVAPVAEASQLLERHGFVIAQAACTDTKTDQGWTQVAVALWTAPCQPAAS